MNEFDHIYADLDGAGRVEQARHIAEQGEEAGFSPAAIADAEQRLASVVSRVARPGYTSDDVAFLVINEQTRTGSIGDLANDRQVAEYRLSYDPETGDVVLARTVFGGDREIVYIAPVGA